MDIFRYTVEELQDYYDKVKDSILENMILEKLITKEEAEEYSKTHSIILKKPNKVSIFFKKLLNEKEQPYHVLTAKINWDFKD